MAYGVTIVSTNDLLPFACSPDFRTFCGLSGGVEGNSAIFTLAGQRSLLPPVSGSTSGQALALSDDTEIVVGWCLGSDAFTWIPTLWTGALGSYTPKRLPVSASGNATPAVDISPGKAIICGYPGGFDQSGWWDIAGNASHLFNAGGASQTNVSVCPDDTHVAGGYPQGAAEHGGLWSIVGNDPIVDFTPPAGYFPQITSGRSRDGTMLFGGSVRTDRTRQDASYYSGGTTNILTAVSGSLQDQALCGTNDGSVIGGWGTDGSRNFPVVWVNNVVTILGLPPGVSNPNVQYMFMSADGSVLGTQLTNDNLDNLFVAWGKVPEVILTGFLFQGNFNTVNWTRKWTE